MQKFLRIIGVLYLILLLATPAWAAGEVSSFRFGGDLFTAGDNFRVDEQVAADRYVAGGEIIIDGQTDGDLLSAGGSLRINGITKGNIRAAGGELHIYGTVDKNVTVAGGTVIVEKDAVIRGNLLAAGGRVAVAGKVLGTAMLSGEQVEIAGEIGSTRVRATELQLGPDAVINGDLNYTATRANIHPQANIKGQIQKKIVRQTENKQEVNPYVAPAISAIGAMILVLLLAYLFPRPTGTAVRSLQTSWGKQLVAGIAFLFGFILLVVLLVFTLVGVPVALLGLLLYIFALLFSGLLWKPMVALWLGEGIHTRMPGVPRIAVALVVVAMLSMVSLVPVLGFIVGFVGFLLSLGVLVNQVVSASRLGQKPIEEE